MSNVQRINRVNCLKKMKLVFNEATNSIEKQFMEFGEEKWQQLVESDDEISRQLKEIMELEQKIDDQLEAMHKDIAVMPKTDWDAKYPNLKDAADVFNSLTQNLA